MVVDTSVLVAILLGEPERELFEDLLLRSDGVTTSAIVLVEIELVMRGKRGEPEAGRIDLLLDTLRVGVQPFDARQADFARDAVRRFGKGRHPAGLNFGDCLVYGLARARQTSLLFKGDDFAQTDIPPAWRPEGATS